MARTITRKHAATLESFGFDTRKVARENRRQTKKARDHRQNTGGRIKSYK